MRFVLLLIVLLVIGLLVNRQLGDPGSTEAMVSEPSAEMAVPNIPTKPQDVPKFEQDMDAFMKANAAERARQLEQAGQ